MAAPRPYPNLLRAVRDGLDEVFTTGRYADRVVADVLKTDARWGARDRAFIAESIYDCVRWWRLLVHLGAREDANHALAAYWWWRYGEVLAQAPYPLLQADQLRQRLAFAKTQRALVQSVPDWLDLLGQEELGAVWPATLEALNQAAEVFLRTNTLKTSRAELVDNLNKSGFVVEADQRTPEAIRVIERKNLWATSAFKAGHFEVQDIASQLVAHALDVKPGMTVIDACAGAGGKALHLAALMQNQGRLLALDTDERKLAELKRRAKRAGVHNLEIRPISSSKIIKRLAGQADRLLLDVPCSGLGVLRRNPDAKWKIQPGFLAEVKSWQADILNRYPSMLKPSGKLVYATCSILPSESEAQVEAFLEAHPTFALEQERRFSPIQGYDGFYVASLQANL